MSRFARERSLLINHPINRAPLHAIPPRREGVSYIEGRTVQFIRLTVRAPDIRHGRRVASPGIRWLATQFGE
jgi:hypothetical protein